MMRPWLKLAVAFGIALSLIAAPCRNCQPKVQTETKDCGHDCCPKPKPQKTESCAWQPAAYDAVETKSDVHIGSPALLPAPAAIELPFTALVRPTVPPVSPAHGPPSIAILRI